MKTRIEYIYEHDYGDDGFVSYQDDVDTLKKCLPILNIFSDKVIDEIYSEWSACEYAASWLCDPEKRIPEFRKWLFEKPWEGISWDVTVGGSGGVGHEPNSIEVKPGDVININITKGGAKK